MAHRQLDNNYVDGGGDIENDGTGSDASSFLEPLLNLKSRTNTCSQIAVVGAKVYPIESLDYEMIETDLFKQDWRSRKRVQIFQYIYLKWTLALLNRIVHRYLTAFAAFAVINVVLAICAYVAPAAAGSGIPEVKAYLNGIDAHSILAPTTLFVKILGSILAVSAGLVVGKEGPMVHTGACIANLLGQGGSRKYALTWKWLRYFKNDRDRRDLITCGAAAFRAPVGGVLFALEEAATWWRSALLWRTFFTTAITTVVLRETMSLAKAAILFRQLALRHLCVIPKTPRRNPVVRILTRHDFMPEHVLGLYPELIHHK
ncbi:hypothetical protein SASPL_133960 [Salvia splendens]|uniref:Chloride channel 7 n=1 Tax=Salvia splendens TaxID=180675 RepID=A0A8X8X400_SALSN|nr:hypothetical protein SASPL_133960 [Salvia splendens]